MDTISERLIDRLALQSALTGLEAVEQNCESQMFHNRIIANNLQFQIDLLKKNESDLKSALDISGHTIEDYKNQLSIARKRDLRNWLLSGGIGFAVGGGCGVAIGAKY